MVIYPDTSFLLALYTPEKETERARAYATRAKTPFIYTPFHQLETRTALRGRVFRRHMSQEQLRSTFRCLEEDLGDEFLRHTPLDWNHVLRKAEEIAETHLIETGARSGDLLHVASAVALHAKDFCTFDHRQSELARRADLKVKAWRSAT